MTSTTNLFDLQDKICVITGGSRGLGKAIAEGYAAAGATVVIASRKLDACQDVADDLAARYGAATAAIACHVGHWSECDALVDAVIERFGRIDVLVNNAGMSPPYGALADLSEELYDKTFAVNLKGPFRLAVKAATQMAAADGGSIINISTIGSTLASPRELPYACAKAGLNVLTAGLAEEFAPSVRVNTILPGAFDTDVTKAWTEDMRSGATVPLGRIGKPGEIVGTAVYFASNASSYTTGSTVRVDGGFARRVGS